MQPFLRGFNDELLKLAEENPREVLRDARKDLASHPVDDSALRKLRGKGGPVSRDYLTSTLIGATTVPLVAFAGKGIARALHNRDVRRALKKTHGPEVTTRLKNELQKGKLIGRNRPDLPLNERPMMNHNELAGSAAGGALTGSVIQMIRDRFSGSGAKDKK